MRHFQNFAALVLDIGNTFRTIFYASYSFWGSFRQIKIKVTYLIQKTQTFRKVSLGSKFCLHKLSVAASVIFYKHCTKYNITLPLILVVQTTAPPIPYYSTPAIHRQPTTNCRTLFHDFQCENAHERFKLN